VPPDQAPQLVQRWQDAWQSFTGLRAAIELRVVRRGEARRSSGVLVLSPTHLRFEALAPLGVPLLIVTAGPDELTVFLPAERRAFRGPPTPEAMTRWLGLPVAVPTLIRLLIGTVPVPDEPTLLKVVGRDDWHLAFDRDGVHHQVWVGGTGEPAAFEFRNGGRLRGRFQRTVDGGLQELQLDVPGRALEAVVRYAVVEPVTPPIEIFQIRLPPDIAIERAD
jgi:hypothetical protein